MAKILVVDDSASILEITKSILEEGGHEVITAEDGQEGLKVARDSMPDLIVLDVMLPKLDGYKVCRMLKHDERYRAIPIILFSARSEDKDTAIGEDVGADAYIPKGHDVSNILEKVNDLLNKQ